MSVKKDLLAEIDKKAQKIRDNRVVAANNKTLETAVFEFFKNVEESRKMHGGTRYDNTLFSIAQRSLQERVSGFDHGSKISIEWTGSENTKSWEEQHVRGVTIWWSRRHLAKNNVDPSYYIDVSQMLFL